jgi:hypothetical protein
VDLDVRQSRDCWFRFHALNSLSARFGNRCEQEG